MRPDSVTPPRLPSTSSIFAARSKPSSAPTRSRSVPARGALRTDLPLCVTRKWMLRVSKGDALQEPERLGQLGLGALQELEPRRRVEEEILGLDGGAGGGDRLRLGDGLPPPRPAHESAHGGAAGAREDLEAADGADGRQGLAAKAQRRDGGQVASSVIFDVAWRWSAMSTSAPVMPVPSSVTRMSCRPASFSSTVMTRPPASIAFSTSSLTTDAGRSTTSPAAILLMR